MNYIDDFGNLVVNLDNSFLLIIFLFGTIIDGMDVKKLPIGIQTFSKLINGNYLYIDKTESIYKLFAEGGQYYFLSRPRRFGKSLLVSTLKEIFSGNKALFKGLWIYDKLTWETYPVIYIDFLKISYNTPQKLENSLEKTIRKIGKGYHVELDKEGDYKDVFAELIEKLSGTNRAAILIDEYDKPIIDFIDKPETAEKNRDILRNFYGVLKGSDEYVKFAFLTGVSKFSKVSVFSGLNNLNDITLDETFSTLAGCTEDELLYYFENRIESLAKQSGKKREEIIQDIQRWYNGYSWDGKNFVYNPLSILKLFSQKEFDNYWFTTGTPTFLIKILREKHVDIREFENLEVDNLVFESYDIDNIEAASLLFQTGYLTIKKKIFIRDERVYYLSYPNQEVRDSFLKHLFKSFTEKEFFENLKFLRKLKSALYQHNMGEFFVVLKSLFASIPYNMIVGDREGYYQTVIYIILRLIGASILPEVETNIGRIDAVIETDKHICIIEFKIGSEKEAMAQIKEKRYYEKYLASAKRIVLVGVGFDLENRNLGNYIIEDFNPLV